VVKLKLKAKMTNESIAFIFSLILNHRIYLRIE